MIIDIIKPQSASKDVEYIAIEQNTEQFKR